jgi:hypothetical protein
VNYISFLSYLNLYIIPNHATAIFNAKTLCIVDCVDVGQYCILPLPLARAISFPLVRTTTLGQSVYPDIALHISNYYISMSLLIKRDFQYTCTPTIITTLHATAIFNAKTLCIVDCVDVGQYCHDWAAKGECTNNPGYMLVILYVSESGLQCNKHNTGSY